MKSRFSSHNFQFSIISLLLSVPVSIWGGVVARFDLQSVDGKITETVSGGRFDILGHFAPENVAGPTAEAGSALRFDGYTSHIDAELGQVLPAQTRAMTFSAWVATPSYPIIQLDTDTRQQTAIVSCLDTEAKSGFGFFLGFNGKYSFKTYIGGWPVSVEGDAPLSTYAWHRLVATVDADGGQIKLYDNGKQVGTASCNGDLSFAAGPFKMGMGDESRMYGPFELMAFNGLVADVEVRDDAASPVEDDAQAPDLDIPASRFAGDILRPRFHGMPAAGWTNECHGMAYSGGRYHLFFQKNADGPYMARLHWGHISSADLCSWREEPIAIAPGEPYDIKGCWSGCVFTDPEITGSLPGCVYTGVDYARATIDYASPLGPELLKWRKSPQNPIIAGAPAGLSDDFRDPYFFRSGGKAYIIVGTSKDGKGATTLHSYDGGKWSNTGDIFFAAANQNQGGTFWEMPNVTPMPGGKWLFTATPLGTAQGVRTLYWTGSIDDGGHFQPADPQPRTVELASKEGFGLLSPTVFQKDGRTIALGIVPDKLSWEDNWNLGWAHCYSLPREWTLDSEGVLLQRPASELTALRTAVKTGKDDFILDGDFPLDPVSGRQVEICATFTLSSSPVGVKIFGDGVISYDPATGMLSADFSKLQRLVNDGGVYDGVYSAALPRLVAPGQELKLDVFVDHSIVDIFVNDSYATSIRVFPTNPSADGCAVFAGAPTQVVSVAAWNLEPTTGSGISRTEANGSQYHRDATYDLLGRCATPDTKGVVVEAADGRAKKTLKW